MAGKGLGELMSPRRLRWLGWGRWGLQDPPEVRCLVEVPGLPPPKAGGFLRVLAHAVDGPLADASDAGRRRRQRLDAELRAHRVDVACLHGLDPEEEGGRDVAAAFFGWGYCGYFASRGRGGDGAAAPGGHAERVAALAAEALGAAPCEARLPQASAIFWDECRWRAVATRSSGGGAAVDLAPRDPDAAEGQVVRVVCIRPSLADCCGEGPGPLLKPAARGPGSAVPPAVVCADLAAVGGAAAAALVPGLDGMRSAMVEVTGAELCAPAPGRGRRGGRTELWSPGSILLRGMSASAVLSGHSERYLADLSGADVAEQLPAGRPPLLAELRWAARAPEGPALAAAAACLARSSSRPRPRAGVA
ncbi:unnamed protein product [Prorocentrum cordatum]|uniref:Uncharacterized protein n=1 Tax=Prorocentrum cordatum TaxID=2364126 RepID=A0ABN9UVW1_9DINO|nr:unnamed protein product [Polarella glacialis]